jgi:hypothetical protein
MDAMSIYDLAFNYVSMFYNVQDITKEIKMEAINNMASLLSKGWTSTEIQYNMDFFKRKYPGQRPNLKTYFNGRAPKRRNLLTDSNAYYYHNALRLTPSPPVVTVDYNTGEITRKVEPYFLEMRASFTIEDLYEYYLKHEDMYNKVELSEAKYIGGLKWLIDKYKLEIVLYMIDMANQAILYIDLPPFTTVMNLQDYHGAAQETFNKRVTDVKIAGDDKIVPKRRMHLGGNRVLDNQSGK